MPAREPAPVLQPEPVYAAPEPVAAYVAPEPEPAPAPLFEPEPVAAVAPPQSQPAYEPRIFEPLRASAYPTTREPALAPAPAPIAAPEPPQPSLAFEAPAPEPVPPAPIAVEVERPRPVAKIVDPLVDDEPGELVFPQNHYADDHRNTRRGGFLGLFGRQRYEQAAPPAHRPSSVSTMPARDDSDDDDLEIPSFLRRLAN